jgi:pimeloyl-ACP methyl ester carboxylesterase
VTAYRESFVQVAGGKCRVWEAGEGQPIGYLAGLGGAPRWSPFLDRLAQTRRVIVPSLPGFPGSEPHHRTFLGHIDWVSATLELLEVAGLYGADLVAASVGGMLAADAAALAPAAIPRLVLAAPMGIYDVDDPGVDPFAQEMATAPLVLTADLPAWGAVFGPDPNAGMEAMVDGMMEQQRAADAAARITWPFGDRGLNRRLHRLKQPTLILWGQEDQILPPTYAKRFATAMGGAPEIRVIDGAGHLLLIDQPDLAADAVLEFLK